MPGVRWFILGIFLSWLAASELVGTGAYGPHRVPLTTLYQPQHGSIGLILKARAGGGPPLRLLLDSGADHLTLEGKAARRSGLAAGEDLDVVGAGSTTRPARFATAERIQVGDLTFPDCSVVIVEGEIGEGVDGVIPLSLFDTFSIRLDIPGKALDLYPYSSESDRGFVKVLAQRNLLFVPARLGAGRDGYLLLDTGSAYNAISEKAAERIGHSRSLGEQVALTAGTGGTGGRMLPGAVPYLLGGRTMALAPVISLDLSQISRRTGVEVSGVIGYPALARSVLTVNYKDALLRIEAK